MIKLTDSAVKRVREMVTESGCSGYSYALDFAETLADDDSVFEQDGVKIIVGETSLPVLDGIELDFVKQGLNQSFKFNNPNVISSCGCGESFSTTK